MDKAHAVDLAVSVSAKSSFCGGAFTAIYAWLGDINWLGVIGAAVAVLSLASQFYFNAKRDRREALEHRKRMGE